MAKKIQDTFVKPLTDEEQEVYELFRDIQNALIGEKFGILENLISEDARFIHLNGKSLGREEYFNDIREDKVDYSAIELHKVQVLTVLDKDPEETTDAEAEEAETAEKNTGAAEAKNAEAAGENAAEKPKETADAEAAENPEEAAADVRIVENDDSQMEMTFAPDAHATLTCVIKTKAKLYGMSRIYTLHTVAEFIRRDGKWKCIGQS